MSRDAHFYLTLPSNASTDIFPDNKMTGYCIKLPETVNLEGDWEVSKVREAVSQVVASDKKVAKS